MTEVEPTTEKRKAASLRTLTWAIFSGCLTPTRRSSPSMVLRRWGESASAAPHLVSAPASASFCTVASTSAVTSCFCRVQ